MYIVDRIEESRIAICEDSESRNQIEIDITQLPLDTKEGDILEFTDGKYFINHERTIERKKELKEKMSTLWKKR